MANKWLDGASQALFKKSVENNAEKLTSAIFDELLKHGLC